MRLAWHVVLLILLASGLSSCGSGDKANAPQAAELTGTWNATKIEYVSSGAPATKVDVIAAGGDGSLVLESDSGYQLTITPAGEQPTVTTGTWELDSDVLTMSPAGMPFSLQFGVAFSEDSLSLTGADAEYDFNGDQSPEPAVLNLSFTR